MNTPLMVTKRKWPAARVVMAGSLALCVVAWLAGKPARADSATFGGSVSATVTVPTLANVVSAASADPSPLDFVFLQGNAFGAAQTSSFSWWSGALSLSSGAAAGWAASGSDDNYAYVAQQVTPTLELTNNNPWGMEIPITATLNYAQNITCSSCGQYDENGASSSAWLYLYTVSPNPYNYLGTMGLNCFLGNPFGPPYNGACQTNTSGVTGSSFPVSGSFSGTLDYWVPADSSATIAVELQSDYQAGVATPEPQSWMLLGTGLLGLTLFIRQRVGAS